MQFVVCYLILKIINYLTQTSLFKITINTLAYVFHSSFLVLAFPNTLSHCLLVWNVCHAPSILFLSVVSPIQPLSPLGSSLFYRLTTFYLVSHIIHTVQILCIFAFTILSILLKLCAILLPYLHVR